MSNMTGSCIYAVTDRQLCKQDLANFHGFFKQGVYEYTKNETDFSPWMEEKRRWEEKSGKIIFGEHNFHLSKKVY